MPLDFVNQGLASLDDLLLILIILLCLVRRIKVKVCLADGFFRIFHPQAYGNRFVKLEEPGLGVLEINPIRDVIQQRLQQDRCGGVFGSIHKEGKSCYIGC